MKRLLAIILILLLIGVASAVNTEKVNAKLDVNKEEAATNEVIVFTDLSTNVSIIKERTWDFGDGEISKEKNPQHSFDYVGEYDVALGVTGENITVVQNVTQEVDGQIIVTNETTTTEIVNTEVTKQHISIKNVKLVNNQKAVGRYSEVTLNNGDVTVTDTNGFTVSSYTKVNGERLAGTTRESDNKLLFESSEGRILNLFGTPTVALEYEYSDTLLKEQIILQADKEITIPLTISQGYQLVPLSNGDIRINNPNTMNWWDGVVIQKPFGNDAAGKYIEMSYNINGTELELVYDHAGITYPLVIDPSYIINGITYNYVHPNKFYGSDNSTVVIRYTIWNTPGSNVTTDLHLGTNIKANFSDIRFMNEDASVQLPAYLNAKNDTMAEILVSAPLTTTGNVVNTFFNSSSGLSNWTAIPGIYTVNSSPYYSQDEWRNYSYDGTNENAVSVAFQDLFGTNTASRYANASATTGTNWVASTPAKEVVSGGVFTLASDTDTALSARLKSYKFVGGQFEFSFDNNGDGEGITARDGLWLAMQDFSNSYRITVGDDYAGNENITISNITAGTMTVMNVTDISALYVSGNKTWVKSKFEETNGSIWVWVRDDAGSYTAAPQIIATNKLANNWSYGYAGFYTTVGTAGAGNLNTNFDDFTVNAESILGYTNIPIGGGRYKPMLRGAQIGEYWDGAKVVQATRQSDDCNWNTSGEYAGSGISHDSANETLVLTLGDAFTTAKYGNGYYTFTLSAQSETSYSINLCSLTASGATGGTKYTIFNSFIRRYNNGVKSWETILPGGLNIASTTPVTINILKIGYTFYFWKDGVYYGSKTDPLTTGSGLLTGIAGIGRYTGSGVINIHNLQINAIDSTSTNGIGVTLGGVPHGARYDTNEYAGLSFTDSTPPNNYNLTLPSKTTATIDPATMQLVFTNTAGTGFSNDTANAMRPLSTLGTTTALNFDNENLKTTSALGNNYLVYVNKTNWVGTQYDNPTGSAYFIPAIYPSGYASTSETGSLWGNWTSNVTSGAYPLPVQFTDVHEQDPAYPAIAWNWSFGDGNFSNLQNPEYTYVHPGIFTVTMNVSNALSFDTYIKTDYMNIAYITPTADYVVNSSEGFYSLAVNFNDTSIGFPTSWNWSFGDGWLSTVQNNTHVYSSGGNYTVNLTVNNTAGSSTKIGYIEVWNYTSVDFSGTPLTGIVPYQVAFTDISSNATSWNWSFGDGNFSDLQNPTNIYYVPGTYTVNHSANNTHDISWENKSDYVTVSPMVASFSGTPTSGSAPLAVTFSGSSTGSPNTYYWIFGDGNTSTLQNPSYTYPDAGVYSVNFSATNTSSGALDWENKSNYITATATLTSSFTYTQYWGVSPHTVSFTDTSTAYPAVTNWNWSYVGYLENSTSGVFSTQQNPTYTFTDGWYQITLNVTSPSGFNLSTQNMWVDSYPMTAVWDSTYPYGEIPHTVWFNGTSDGLPSEYIWEFGDGSTTTTTSPPYSLVSHTYTTVGNYSVNFTARNATYNVVAHSNATEWVQTTPGTIDFSPTVTEGYAPLNVTFVAHHNNNPFSSFTPNHYTWYFGDGNTSNEASPSHVYVSNGTYDVNLQVVNYLTATDAWANKTGLITVAIANNSGDLIYTPDPVLLAITFINSETSALISVVSVVDSYGYTTTVTNGTYLRTYNASSGTVSLYVSSSGYTDQTGVYTIVEDPITETMLLVPTATGGTSTTWYVPKTVEFQVVNYVGNQIPGASVSAVFNSSSTLAGGNSDLVNWYGMNPTAANNAVNGTLSMSGYTDNKGSIVFTMLSTLSYDVTVTNGASTNFFVIHPQNDFYLLRFLLATGPDTSLATCVYANGNTHAGLSSPDPYNMTLMWSYQDTCNLTTALDYYVKDINNGSFIVYYYHLSPVTAGVYVNNLTVPNVRGQIYTWYENYTRSV